MPPPGINSELQNYDFYILQTTFFKIKKPNQKKKKRKKLRPRGRLVLSLQSQK
jgi:hypothetical protein